MFKNQSFWFILLLIFIITFLSPFFCFCLGWMIGLLIRFIFGEVFIQGLSLFNLNITYDQIPLFCGVLGVIGSFFRSAGVDNNN